MTDDRTRVEQRLGQSVIYTSLGAGLLVSGALAALGGWHVALVAAGIIAGGLGGALLAYGVIMLRVSGVMRP